MKDEGVGGTYIEGRVSRVFIPIMIIIKTAVVLVQQPMTLDLLATVEERHSGGDERRQFVDPLDVL